MGFRILYCGKELYPSEPQTTSITKALSLPLTEDTLYVLCSPLLWYGVDELVSRLPAGCVLCICELDEALLGLLDWEAKRKEYLDNRSVLVIPESKAERILPELVSVFSRKITRIKSISLNAGRLLHSEEYQNLVSTAEEELRRFWRNTTTTLVMGPLWIRNLLKNCDRPPSHRDIADLPRSDHVVVCGAGPSLEQAIPLICKHRKDLYLIAVDTALPVLYGFGLEPDLIVALESQIANLKDFVPCGRHHPALAYDLSSTTTVLHSVDFSEHYLFASNFADGTHWARLKKNDLLPTLVPPLGSVGVCALYLSHFCARVSVSIAGLDFGWKPGLSHARGSPAHLYHLFHQNRLTNNAQETVSLEHSAEKVTGINGIGLLTDRVLSSYADSTNEVIAFLESKGLSVLDLRSQGLKLQTSGSVADFEALLGTAVSEPQQRPSLGTAAPKLASLEAQKSASVFLRELAEDIEKCSEVIQEELSAPGSKSAEVLVRMANLDFLFYDIPDREWPSTEPHALVRALAKLGRFSSILSRSEH